MKITVTETMFKEQFVTMGRADNFSSAGLSALYDYCVELEKDLGEEYELDIIELCCTFSETSYAEIADDYSIDLSGCDGREEEWETVHAFLTSVTVVVDSDFIGGTILYQDF